MCSIAQTCSTMDPESFTRINFPVLSVIDQNFQMYDGIWVIFKYLQFCFLFRATQQAPPFETENRQRPRPRLRCEDVASHLGDLKTGPSSASARFRGRPWAIGWCESVKPTACFFPRPYEKPSYGQAFTSPDLKCASWAWKTRRPFIQNTEGSSSFIDSQPSWVGRYIRSGVATRRSFWALFLFVTYSGPINSLIVAGDEAVAKWRELMGPTKAAVWGQK